MKIPDYSMDVKDSILKPEGYGMVNGQVALNGWIGDATALRGFFAPPYYSNDFELNIRLNGFSVQADHAVWAPDVLTRSGVTRQHVKVTSRLMPYMGRRAVVMQVELQNLGHDSNDIQLQLEAIGGVFHGTHWGFPGPWSAMPGKAAWNDGIFSLTSSDDDRLSMAVTLPLTPHAPLCTGVFNAEPMTLQPREKRIFHVCLALAGTEESDELVRELLEDPKKAMARSARHWQARVRTLYETLPSFSTDNPAWQRLYDRSLLHFLLCEWNVPEFIYQPYYATGGINGRCLENYLWNYGEPYRMWSLLNPKSAREHLKSFLNLDLCNAFSYHPDDGAPCGPYYPINQEKVIFLIHAYVLQTGDTAFLHELFKGKTILEHALEQALMHDDLSKPAVLANYGDGNHHLELLTEYRYDGLVPDLNLRRCVNMQLTAELYELAGITAPVDLRKRADALRQLVYDTLYDPQAGWYAAIDESGKKTLRYTMQMFKALGWHGWTMGENEEQTLIRHLMNPDEFLGEFGLHSLSKLDPAYDPFDPDNGGPGCCPSFAPAIIDRLYRSGHAEEAETIFKRLRWLAECMPYWGDSQRADLRDYCHTSPIMFDIQGTALAQSIIFGMFGLDVRTDFSVVISPHLPSDTDYIELTSVRLAGKTLHIRCSREDGVTVHCDGTVLTCSNGESLVIPRN